MPIDDFEYVHRLLGVLCIGFIMLGAAVWLATMVPACASGTTDNACLAFARGGADGKQFDPFRNVVILRLIVAPLWGTVLPLMLVAQTTWHSFEASAPEKAGFLRRFFHYSRHLSTSPSSSAWLRVPY